MGMLAYIAGAELGLNHETFFDELSAQIGGYVGWGVAVSVAVIAVWKVKKYVTRAG